MADRLEYLLREAVRRAPRGPSSPECLSIGTILRLLDQTGEGQQQVLEHLASCHRCQWAVTLVRRDRELIEALWSDADQTEPDSARERNESTAPDAGSEPSRVLRHAGWLTGWPSAVGVAAVVVFAVGLSWWLTSGRPIGRVGHELLGPISGFYDHASVTRCQISLRGGGMYSGSSVWRRRTSFGCTWITAGD